MKLLLALTAIGVAAAPALQAQAPANPVVTSSREIFDRQQKFILAAAEEMPADKYTFKPTATQWTYGKTIAHIVGGNTHVCAMLTTTPVPATIKAEESDSKEVLNTQLKASFDYCAKALDSLQDSQLGDPITFFGGRKTVRARALMELTIDVVDHYSQMAGYLRLNNLVPPSAAPRK
jgi:uncharacterized damage-inducible protein DinB